MPVHAPLVLELLSWGATAYPRKPQTWPSHVHAHHQLDVTLGGEVVVDGGDGRAFRSRRGDALLMPPLARHAHRTRSGMRIAMFFFRVPPAHWPRLGRRLFHWRASAESVRAIERACEAKRREADLAGQQGAAALTLCLVEAARRLGQARGDAEPGDAFQQRLWGILERAENEPHAGWSVEGLAAACHVSPDHFGKRFRELLKLTPREYLLRLRVRASAQRLAAEPEAAIKEIAAQAGYANVHAFTRAFQRAIGMSPGAFRRASGAL